MAKLTDEHRTFMVTEFACFKNATMIQKSLKEDFNIEADLHSILYYNPENATGGKKLGKKWKKIFEEARARYISNISSVGLAHQSYRIRVQQMLLDRELERGAANKGLVLDILERGAKETGGAYTNRRELSGPGGTPIQTQEMTLEQWKAQAAERRNQAARAIALGGGEDE